MVPARRQQLLHQEGVQGPSQVRVLRGLPGTQRRVPLGADLHGLPGRQGAGLPPGHRGSAVPDGWARGERD